MIYFYLTICFLLTLLLPNATIEAFGVSSSNVYGAFTYSFMHTSLLHLAINAFCLSIMYRPIRVLYCKRFGDISDLRFFSLVFFAAVIAAFPALQTTPTIGGSGIVFALLGMLLLLNPTLKQLKAYVYVALALLIQLYFGKSNVTLHVCAFIAGALVIIIRTAYDIIRVQGEE